MSGGFFMHKSTALVHAIYNVQTKNGSAYMQKPKQIMYSYNKKHRSGKIDKNRF